MDRARGQFLARAGGADDENAAVGRRHPFDGLAQLRDCRRPADQRGRLRRHLLELLDLAFEPRCFECALGHQHQPVGLERFFDEIIGAVLDGSDRGFDVAMAGDHHQRHLGMFLLDGIEQLQAVELAALQPNVEENQVRFARHDGGQRVIAVARGACVVAFVLQDAGHQIADVGLVIDNENICDHGLRPVHAVLFFRLGTLRVWPAAAKRTRTQAPR